MKYEVVTKFKGSPDGCRILNYEVGQQLEVNTDFSEDLATVAVTEGWVKEVKPIAVPKKKAAVKKK